MIWSVVSKSEMEGYKIPPVFHHYQEALGRDNITLAVVDDDDPLNFVNPATDVVLLRTASRSLVNTIRKIRVRSTAEDYDKYTLVADKTLLSDYLKCEKILVPKQYYIDEIINGRTYFVKPRFGSESFGISDKSICRSKSEILTQLDFLKNNLKAESVIEEFIPGSDCTVACYRDPTSGEIKTYAIEVECFSAGGIQTHEGKISYDEFCVVMFDNDKKRIEEISRRVFQILDIKHHSRFDFRKTADGRLFLIDVNLIPGLGPLGDFAKCMLLTDNHSYIDMLNAVINSASI